MQLFILDYGAGNVCSLANSLEKLGHSFQWIQKPKDFDHATVRATPSTPLFARAPPSDIQ